MLLLLLSYLGSTGWLSMLGLCAADHPSRRDARRRGFVGSAVIHAAASSARLRYVLLLLLSCLGGTGWRSMLGSCAADRPSRRDARRRGFVGSAVIHAAAPSLVFERHRLALDARLMRS
jgi:hypothetical protein